MACEITRSNVALPSSLMKSSQQVVVVEGSDVKCSHTNWSRDPAQIRHNEPRISEHVAVVESRNQMVSRLPPCVCKNRTKQMILSLFLKEFPLFKRTVVKISSTAWRSSSIITENINLERAHKHTHTFTHKQTEMVKLDLWRKQAGAKRKLGLAALPLPTWWTVSLDGPMSGVSELEFSTWWFPSANSGSRWVSCEAEFPIPRCIKWLVSTLPLWFSIPPFDIAMLQQ